MKTIIKNIQTELVSIPTLKYVDEDWGQLDYYSTNFPVQWPCVLIDITNANFDDAGSDRTAVPIHRQMAEGMVTITVANMKLTNTSGKAPTTQKDTAWSIFDLIDEIHMKLHGFNPATKAGALMRKSQNRVIRDDGVQEYKISYSFSITNV